MSQINFEKDLLKHYVRKYGWLRAAKKQKQAIKNRSKNIPLRYFTFCAAEAIDVFMLEREGILERSKKTGYLEGVYFCERDSGNFARIADLLGLRAQGFPGEFEKIVLFEDDKDTEGKTRYDGNYYPSQVRKKLMNKDAHCRLRKAFPFDIINLDVCGVMFPPKKGVMAPLLRSLIQILEWQTESRFSINNLECEQFTLFLTSHVDQDDTNRTAIEQLEKRVNDNISTNRGFQSAFFNRYGHDQAGRLACEDFADFFCIALPKYIIHTALHKFGWEITSGPTYLFNRDYRREKKQYQIMHTVSVCERIPNFQKRLDVPNMDQYTRLILQLAEVEFKRVDRVLENLDINQELEEDLKKIIELRNQHQKPQ